MESGANQKLDVKIILGPRASRERLGRHELCSHSLRYEGQVVPQLRETGDPFYNGILALQNGLTVIGVHVLEIEGTIDLDRRGGRSLQKM